MEDVTGARWRKSSYSNGSGSGACVEVAQARAVVAVRDSKDPDGPKLTFMAAEWKAFTRRVKAGQVG